MGGKFSNITNFNLASCRVEVGGKFSNIPLTQRLVGSTWVVILKHTFNLAPCRVEVGGKFSNIPSA